MALLSIKEYYSNGVNKNYIITFKYIAREDIHVFIEGIETTAFTWQSDGTIELDKAAPKGDTVRLQRFTQDDAKLVDFKDGSILKEADLDLSTDQTFYIAQEVRDKTTFTMTVSQDSKWDCENRSIKNLKEGVTDDEAANVGQIKAPVYEAETHAQAAAQSAVDANASADDSFNFSEEAKQHALAASSYSQECSQFKYETEVIRNNTEIIKNEVDYLKNETITIKEEAQDAADKAEKIAASAFNMPVGAMIALPVDHIPLGLLECDGSTIYAREYPDLVAYLTGDPHATEATLPDMRGLFVRGLDRGRGIDSEGAARVIGSEQDWAVENITGIIDGLYGEETVMAKSEGSFFIADSFGGSSGYKDGIGTTWKHKYLNFDASRVVKTSTETRPANVALIYAIKAFDTATNTAKSTLETLINDAKGAVHTPLGCIVQWQKGVPPAGWMELNGDTVRATEYPEFVEKMAGVGATEYTLLDMRGEFARGWDHARGVDVGRSLGSEQGDDTKPYTIEDLGNTYEFAPYRDDSPLDRDSPNYRGACFYKKGMDLHDKILVMDSTETRPRNLSTMYIIKVYDVADGQATTTLETLIQDAKAAAHTPIGTVVDWPLAIPPSGWLELNGQIILAVDYPVLVKRLAGATATEATLLDCRGEFTRGWDNGRGVDAGRDLGSWQEDASKVLMCTLGLSTDQLPPYMGDAIKGLHTHYPNVLRMPVEVTGPFKDVTSDVSKKNSSAEAFDSKHGSSTETRPRNIAMMRIIKAADYVDDPDSILADDVIQKIDTASANVARLEGLINYHLIDAGTITTSTRYVFDNPFGNAPVIPIVEVQDSLGKWADPKWLFNGTVTRSEGAKVAAYGDEIVIQVGSFSAFGGGQWTGSPSNGTGITPSPARVHVWRCAA